jgi:hypothetical protein
MAIRVPNTTTFSLQDVVNAVKDHNSNVADNLGDCFNKSVMDYFDINYVGYPTNSMLRFRNYGPNAIPCDTNNSYSGAGPTYPTVIDVNLGSSTGIVVLQYNPYAAPDRFIVEYNGIVVIDTLYRGDSSTYNYGGSDRTAFKNSLLGKLEPHGGFTYPNFTYHPEDGYPLVAAQFPNYQFNKTASSPTTAKIRVYAPMASTMWNCTLKCPV